MASRRLILAVILILAVAASSLALTRGPCTGDACTLDPITLAGGLPGGLSDRDRFYLEALSGRTLTIPADRLGPLEGASAGELCILALTRTGWEPLHFVIARSALDTVYEPAPRLEAGAFLAVNMPTYPPLPLEGAGLPWLAGGARALYVIQVERGGYTYPLLVSVGGVAESLGCGALQALVHDKTVPAQGLPLAGDPPWSLPRALRNLTRPEQALELLAASLEGSGPARAVVVPGPAPPPAGPVGWVVAWSQDLSPPGPAGVVLGAGHGDTWSIQLPLASDRLGLNATPAGMVIVLTARTLDGGPGLLAGTVRVDAGGAAWERGFVLYAAGGQGRAVVPLGLGEPWTGSESATVEVRISAAPGQAWILAARAGVVYVAGERPPGLGRLAYEALYEPVRTVDTALRVTVGEGEHAGSAVASLYAPSRLALDASGPQEGPTLRLRLRLPEGFPGGTLRVSGVPLAGPAEARIPAMSEEGWWETSIVLPMLGGAATALGAADPMSTAVFTVVLDEPAQRAMEILVEAETVEPARLPAIPLVEAPTSEGEARLPLLDPNTSLVVLSVERGLRSASLLGPGGPGLVEARIVSSMLYTTSVRLVVEASHKIKEAWSVVEAGFPGPADVAPYAYLRAGERPERGPPGIISRRLSVVSWSASPGYQVWEYAGGPRLEHWYNAGDGGVTVRLHAYPAGWALDALGLNITIIVHDIIPYTVEEATVRLAGATIVLEDLGQVSIGPTSPANPILRPWR